MKPTELLDNGRRDGLMMLDLAIFAWLWYLQQEPMYPSVLVPNLKSCAKGNYLQSGKVT